MRKYGPGLYSIHDRDASYFPGYDGIDAKTRGEGRHPEIMPHSPLVVLTMNGTLYALDESTGVENWRINSGPVIQGEMFLFVIVERCVTA